MDDILEFIFEFIMECFGAVAEEIIESVVPEEKRLSKWIKFATVVFSVVCVAMILVLILGAAFLISDDGNKKLGRIFLSVSVLWFTVTAIVSIINKIKKRKVK